MTQLLFRNVVLASVFGLYLLTSPSIANAQEPMVSASLRDIETIPNKVLVSWKGHRDWGVRDFITIRNAANDGDAFAIAVQAGRKAVEDKDGERAIAAFQEAARLRPEEAPFDEIGDVLAKKGEREAAIAAYRQIVYRDASKPTRRDWKDSDGSSIRAKVAASYDKSYVARGSIYPEVLMRYMLLLLDSNRYEEAKQVYQWGYEACQLFVPRFEGMYPLFSPEKIARTDTEGHRNQMKAAAHVFIGLEFEARTKRDAVLPPGRTVAEMAEALKLDPDMTAAYVFLGNALDMISFSERAREAWNIAALSTEPLVREAALNGLNGKR